MQLARTALIATAACLIGAAAYAQPASSDTSQSAPQTAPDNSAPPSSMSSGASSSAQTGTATNASTTVDANGNAVVASQPVPDTAANRASYGQPLSRAGKRTKPAGN
jgi:hypothetical protein